MALYADIGGALPPQGNNPFGWAARDYLNVTPEAGYNRFLQNFGYGMGNDPRSKFAQGRFGRYYGQYQADAADDPMMGFYDYLLRQGDPGKEFAQQSAAERGDFSSRSMTPRVRWVL